MYFVYRHSFCVTRLQDLEKERNRRYRQIETVREGKMRERGKDERERESLEELLSNSIVQKYFRGKIEGDRKRGHFSLFHSFSLSLSHFLPHYFHSLPLFGSNFHLQPPHFDQSIHPSLPLFPPFYPCFSLLFFCCLHHSLIHPLSDSIDLNPMLTERESRCKQKQGEKTEMCFSHPLSLLSSSSLYFFT